MLQPADENPLIAPGRSNGFEQMARRFRVLALPDKETYRALLAGRNI